MVLLQLTLLVLLQLATRNAIGCQVTVETKTQTTQTVNSLKQQQKTLQVSFIVLYADTSRVERRLLTGRVRNSCICH
jgi:hypothetical protein